MEKAEGGSSDVGVGSTAAVQCQQGGPQKGQLLQVSCASSCPGWRWHPSYPRSALEGLRHLGLSRTGPLEQECLTTCRHHFLQGDSAGHPPIWRQNLGSLLECFDMSWGIPHSCRLMDSKDAQAKAGAGEGVDLSTVSGCATGVWNENNWEVYWHSMADNCGVHGNPPNPKQMQKGQAKGGSGTTSMVVGTAHGPGGQQHIWVRLVIVHLGFCFCFCMGMSMPGGYKTMTYCVGSSLVKFLVIKFLGREGTSSRLW